MFRNLVASPLHDGPDGDDVRKVLADIEMISAVLEMLRGRKLPKDKQGGPFEYTASTAIGPSSCVVAFLFEASLAHGLLLIQQPVLGS